MQIRTLLRVEKPGVYVAPLIMVKPRAWKTYGQTLESSSVPASAYLASPMRVEG